MESGLPRFRQNFSCSVLLRIRAQFHQFRIRDFHPLWSAFPDSSPTSFPLIHVLQPQHASILVWPVPRSLAATNRISIDFSSSRYLDVSVPSVRSLLPIAHNRVTPLSGCRVSPFGNLRVKACLTALRSISLPSKRPSSPLTAKISNIYT